MTGVQTCALPICFPVTIRMNWADLDVLSDSGINWSDLDLMHDAGINWSDLDILSDAGVNWVDIVNC